MLHVIRKVYYSQANQDAEIVEASVCDLPLGSNPRDRCDAEKVTDIGLTVEPGKPFRRAVWGTYLEDLNEAEYRFVNMHSAQPSNLKRGFGLYLIKLLR